MFVRVGLPYKVVGGTRFYERREVKDALAYLRVLANPADTVNLRRILNVPKRGIGDRAEACVSALADRERISFNDALSRADDAPASPPGRWPPSTAFTSLLDELRTLVEGGAGPGHAARGDPGADRLPRRAAGQPRPAGRDPDREPRRARRGRAGVRGDRAGGRR